MGNELRVEGGIWHSMPMHELFEDKRERVQGRWVVVHQSVDPQEVHPTLHNYWSHLNPIPTSPWSIHRFASNNT